MKKRKSKKQLKEQSLLYNLGYQIKQLEAQKLGLQQQQEQLESEQQSLVVKQAALAACCDLLHWLRTGQVDRGWRVSKDKWGLPGELQLLQDLLGLQADSSTPLASVLKELTIRERQQQGVSGSSASSRDSAGAAAVDSPQVQAAQQQQQQPFSASEPFYLMAPGDYSGLLRYVYSQPPYPGAEDMNLQQFGEYYCAHVQKCALNLAQAEAQVPLLPYQTSNGHQDMQPSSGSTDEQQQQWGCGRSFHPLLELQQLTLQHVRLIMSLSMLHRGDLLQRIRASQWLSPQVPGVGSTLQVADNGEQVRDALAAGMGIRMGWHTVWSCGARNASIRCSCSCRCFSPTIPHQLPTILPCGVLWRAVLRCAGLAAHALAG